MNVSQYIAAYLASRGVDTVFMLVGGGSMFLNDALAFHEGLSAVYCHHEQACAMAAEGYARVKGAPGVLNVTTGPGGINALNGVFGAFTDSIPMLVLSGQVKRATHLRSNPVPGLRQLGDQEVDIVAIASPVCKRAASLFDPLGVPEALGAAWALCQAGRPGPVWLDIPIDVQSAPLPDELCAKGLAGSFDLHDGAPLGLCGDELAETAFDVARQIAAASRPLMLWGTGVRLSDGTAHLLAAAESLDCPIATAWTHDTLPSAHRLHAGRPGTIGTRAGNFVLQSCDLLVVLGSRLNVRQTSYNFNSFAKNAKIIHVDIDSAEFSKPGISVDQTIFADLRLFAPALESAALRARVAEPAPAPKSGWIEWIAQRKARYPNTPPAARLHGGVREGFINPYAFVDHLVRALPDSAIIATGNASACILPFQCAELREGMRLFSNSGCASMGYDIPASIGAACAAPDRRVICLAGDGSAQLNIQELETISRLRLDIKIVILDNGGYLSMRSSQSNFFGRLAGCDPSSGVGFPDYCKVAQAYGVEAVLIDAHDWRSKLDAALALPGPLLIHAKLDPAQGFEPRMSSRKLPDGRIVSPEIEDMHPFLDRGELERAMDPGLSLPL